MLIFLIALCVIKFLQEKLLSNVLTQIDQLRASITMKQDEMGTELVDHLTPEEKDSLSRLNPEITTLKEKLIACRSNRIEVFYWILVAVQI